MSLPRWLKQASPLAAKMSANNKRDFANDFIAGLIVAIMLVPQSMAYAIESWPPPAFAFV